MSISGWAPWLLDQFEPDPDAFATYTRQLSVLLPTGKRRHREVPSWRAWVPSKQALRACPQCVAESKLPHPYQLMWSLPLMLSCPFHCCLLEPHIGVPGHFLAWESATLTARPAPEAVLTMDRRTWHAMTTGSVELPRRRVHAGVWFRLIRTIIDELSTPVSECGAASRLIRHVWEETGYPVRAGQLVWRPHEDFPLVVQLRTLEAVAMAIHLLESKTITGRGPDAALFFPQPPASVYGGDVPAKDNIAEHWARARALFDEVVEEARHDPIAAQRLFNMVTCWQTSPAAILAMRVQFVDLGIPEEFLSHSTKEEGLQNVE